MKLLKGDIVGIIVLVLIFGGFLILLYHLSFLPLWLKIGGFFSFSIWIFKGLSIIF